MADRKPALEPAVTAFLERLAGVDYDGAMALAAHWNAVDPGARQRAWQSVERLAKAHRRSEHVDAVREAVTDWARTWSGWAWGVYGWEGIPMGPWRREVWQAAVPAAIDAGVAILLGDRLEPDDRVALIGPWEAFTAADET